MGYQELSAVGCKFGSGHCWRRFVRTAAECPRRGVCDTAKCPRATATANSELIVGGGWWGGWGFSGDVPLLRSAWVRCEWLAGGGVGGVSGAESRRQNVWLTMQQDQGGRRVVVQRRGGGRVVVLYSFFSFLEGIGFGGQRNQARLLAPLGWNGRGASRTRNLSGVFNCRMRCSSPAEWIGARASWGLEDSWTIQRAIGRRREAGVRVFASRVDMGSR